MGYIEEISVNDKKRWNEFVKSFKEYDVFYLNEYVTAFMNEDSSNGIPLLLYYQNGTDRAINVVFKRDVSLDKNFRGKIEAEKFFDLVSPYGYGGFWGEITDYNSLNQNYNAYCISNQYISEFVRFELFSDYSCNYDGEVETRTHNVVRNLEQSLDEIWMDFKQKVRKNVKKANSNNLKIIIENTGKYLDSFLDIYYSTMNRSEAGSEFYFSRKFFEMLNQMQDNVMYFHVIYGEKIVSTELVLYGAENCYSYLGGTNQDYFELRPNDFLKYEIIKWAHEKGLKNFVLGGGYGADDGIFRYKASLAPKGIVDFYIGKKIFDRKLYNYLISVRCQEKSEDTLSDFFPRYRA
ncbi:MAG: GNAT family N-acetyltransferase [Lachnospiraceae bacterium]|nr:GNAT family N-acetyltransferase [Lachnospiraceae bacterium]